MPRGRPLALFGLALGLRLAYLFEIRTLPWFGVPLIDGANYFRTARAIAGGQWLGGPEAFWQPPLYPYFLAVLLRLLGERMIAIDIVQAVLGALSCVLVFAIGRRILGSRAGTAAGLVMALYGPLIHFDAQPLIPVLHIVLMLAGIDLLLAAGLAADPGRHPLRWTAAGICWGLSAIATPNLLLAVPAVALWIAGRKARVVRGALSGEVAALRRNWRSSIVFLVAVAAPVLLVGARNFAVAGEPVLISSNGGINFYLGNNADYERTLRLRPGGEFERLAQEPENLGIVGAAAASRYFTSRAITYLVSYPESALRLYLRKARDLVAGREIPRNENMYEYRGTSLVLRALLWRCGIAFPFGVMAPLALAGICAGWGAGRRLLLLIAVSYAASILIFFPTDRYRLPLVPILALFAGAILGAPRAIWKRPAVVGALIAGLLLFNLDARRPTESWPEEAALNRAYALRVQGRLPESRREYERALAINPKRIDPYNALAVMAADAGDWEEAARRYRELLGIAPDFVEVRRNLGQALLALGRKEEARKEWEQAIHLAPGAGLALADLSLSYLEEGVLQTAFDYAGRAAASRPDLPETHYALALSARALRKRDLALREFDAAARLFPPGSPGRRRAQEILEIMRRRGADPA
jgi:tetratricopeptide (TPR) repeat protein